MHEAIAHALHIDWETRKVVLSRLTERYVSLAGAILCVLCVAYFCLLDRILFSTATFSPIFRVLLTKYDVQAAWLALAICLLAGLWKRPAPILHLVDFVAKHPRGFASLSVGILSILAIALYRDYPLSMDEYAAVFQSKVFASGRLMAQVPPNLVDWLVVRGFNGAFLIASSETGRAMEAYWPGFAFILTPFQFLNVPWLCNAALSGLSIFLIFWITRAITEDRRAGGWAILFALASGAFNADGISYYSMQAHLTANLLFVALLIEHSAGRAFCAGLVGSLALNLHNPFPHALFAVPWIAVLATQRSERRRLLSLLAGYLPGIGIGLLWLTLRSEVGLSGHGWSATMGVFSGVFTWPNMGSLNSRIAALVKMCVWAMPCLFAFAILGYARKRTDLRVRLLAWSAMLTFVAYIFVRFDQGHGWGYRYFHSAWGAVPILAGCAMVDRTPNYSRLVSFAGATAILSLLLIVPFQMSQIGRVMSQHLSQLAPPRRPGNNIYFVHPLGGFYLADMIQFDPLLRNQDLLLVSHGAILDAQMVQGNWQNAVRVSSDRSADQWYLGSNDQRLSVPGKKAERRFVISQIPR